MAQWPVTGSMALWSVTDRMALWPVTGSMALSPVTDRMALWPVTGSTAPLSQCLHLISINVRCIYYLRFICLYFILCLAAESYVSCGIYTEKTLAGSFGIFCRFLCIAVLWTCILRRFYTGCQLLRDVSSCCFCAGVSCFRDVSCCCFSTQLFVHLCESVDYMACICRLCMACTCRLCMTCACRLYITCFAHYTWFFPERGSSVCALCIVFLRKNACLRAVQCTHVNMYVLRWSFRNPVHCSVRFISSARRDKGS